MLPLLKLPVESVKNVLLNMELMEQVAFSFCSKRAKLMVINLEIKAKYVHNIIYDYVAINIIFEDDTEFFVALQEEELQEWLPGDPKIDVKDRIPDFADVTFVVDGEIKGGTKTWAREGYTYKDWADHLLEIFKYRQTERFEIAAESELWDVASLMETLCNMEVNPAAFPLLYLPEEAFRNVFMTMDTIDLVGFSLISDTAEQILLRCKPKVKRITTTVDRIIKMCIELVDKRQLELIFHNDEIKNWQKGDEQLYLDIMEPTYVEARSLIMLDGELHETGFVEWENDFTYKDWTNHLLKIVESDFGIECKFRTHGRKFDIQSVASMLEKSAKTTFSVISRSNAYHHNVHKELHPMNRFSMNRIPYLDLPDYHRFIFQNFRELRFSSSANIQLDEILLTNSDIIGIFNSTTITAKDVRRFIKMWMKGFNRLGYFYISLQPNIVLSKDIVLRGVKCKEISGKVFEIHSRFGEKAHVRFLLSDLSNHVQFNII